MLNSLLTSRSELYLYTTMNNIKMLFTFAGVCKYDHQLVRFCMFCYVFLCAGQFELGSHCIVFPWHCCRRLVKCVGYEDVFFCSPYISCQSCCVTGQTRQMEANISAPVFCGFVSKAPINCFVSEPPCRIRNIFLVPLSGSMKVISLALVSNNDCLV